MTRLAYPDADDPDLTILVRRIHAERGVMPNLYRMLLHSPPVAEGWLDLLTAIRQKTALSGYVREMAVLRVASLNRADYEFHAHVKFALAEGLSQLQIDKLRGGDVSGFNERDRAVLDYCTHMTQGIQVPEPVFAAMRAIFSDREVVELTATIGAYHLVTRFLEAIEIGRH